MNWWKELAFTLLGFGLALLVAMKLKKPETVNNIENNTKIKNNKAPIKDVNVETNTITPKEKKKRLKWLKRVFKRKKK